MRALPDRARWIAVLLTQSVNPECEHIMAENTSTTPIDESTADVYLSEMFTLKMPRFQQILIGRVGRYVSVDMTKYPSTIVSRLWRYGHKRRLNDHQSGWGKEAYAKMMKRAVSDDEHHAFLMLTAQGCRDDMIQGDWKEGGGSTLARGVKEMRIEIVAAYKKSSVELKVNVTDLIELSSATPFAVRLIKAIAKRDGLKIDIEGSAKDTEAKWRKKVEKDLEAAKDQGGVVLVGADDVVEELSS